MDGEAVVVVVTIGVVAAGAGHGLLWSSNRQLTETSFHTTLTSLPAVTGGLQPTQAWDIFKKSNTIINYEQN